jgi:Flp pilus assembly protein TadG
MITTLTQHRHKQLGSTTVEFAIIGAVAFMILFGAIEVSRLLFTLNMLEEATRRGARMAAVCEAEEPADPAIAEAAIFADAPGDTTSPFMNGLTTANINVEYLDGIGDVVTGYSNENDSAPYNRIRYLRVSITNYSYDFIVPGFDSTFITNSYPTVLPIESLGIHKGGERSDC